MSSQNGEYHCHDMTLFLKPRFLGKSLKDKMVLTYFMVADHLLLFLFYFMTLSEKSKSPKT